MEANRFRRRSLERKLSLRGETAGSMFISSSPERHCYQHGKLLAKEIEDLLRVHQTIPATRDQGATGIFIAKPRGTFSGLRLNRNISASWTGSSKVLTIQASKSIVGTSLR